MSHVPEKNKMKKYQITGQILIAADGWVKAKNTEEAKRIWKEYCFVETGGMSVLDVEINEVITPQSKFYDKKNVPQDEEFEGFDENCLTANYWN